MQVEPSPTLTTVQQENQSYHKNNICWKPDPSRIKMYNFNKALKNEKAKHLSLKQLFHNVLDVNLKMYTPETVLIHTGINNVLNDKSQSNNENLLSNIK